MANGNHPAFPRPHAEEGMTYREYLAAEIARGLDDTRAGLASQVANRVVQVTDAIIAQLEKTKKDN